MNIFIKERAREAGISAGRQAADLIRATVAIKGSAAIILATGTSQFDVLDQLTSETDIPWHQVAVFHLDEYIGLPPSHPASFRNYLQERFVNKAPGLRAVYFIDGLATPRKECDRLEDLLHQHAIDLALVGIGENGHLAFNDPPADLDARRSFLVVDLDEKCRRQQVNEGWFDSIEEVPRKAISMSIPQILRAEKIVVTVPGKRKAEAVKHALEGHVDRMCPASVLQRHPECYLYLDEASASLLCNKPDAPR